MARFRNESWSDSNNNLYGCLNQLYLLKLRNRNLKLLLSVGGASYASSFSFLDDPTSRQEFVSSSVQLITDYGFDGIDIDMEFPKTASQGQNLADLSGELRAAFKKLEQANGNASHYQLSAAVSAGVDNSAYLVIPKMDKALDFWNIMSYDYSGNWTSQSDNQANLYNVPGSVSNASTDDAVNRFILMGATANKIVMGNHVITGIPLFGQLFEGTSGIGQHYSKVGSADEGSIPYKKLPLDGATVVEDNITVSSYSYNSETRELVSYDTPAIVRMKADYVVKHGLAGAMYWEISGDKVGPESLVAAVAGVFHSLDQTQNCISYPDSKWDNIRNNTVV
ncbi:glycoside hydrolase [Mycena sp. CBHHK59/15]|nr:glycoside hydrolase [Mycena sp. CBHHK59/15]